MLFRIRGTVIELHVLGRSEDGSTLLLAAHPEAELPGYTLTIDSLGDHLDPGGRSDLTAELDRSDEPVEPERVLPEGPLEVESPDEVLDAARGLWLVHDDAISDATLHDAVIANLHKWNVRIPQSILDDGWWVTKLGDRAWQISFRFLSRGRIHEAEWVLDTEDARLVPENDLADRLGWWKKRQPKPRSRRRRGGRSRGRSRSQSKKT